MYERKAYVHGTFYRGRIILFQHISCAPHGIDELKTELTFYLLSEKAYIYVAHISLTRSDNVGDFFSCHGFPAIAA